MNVYFQFWIKWIFILVIIFAIQLTSCTNEMNLNVHDEYHQLPENLLPNRYTSLIPVSILIDLQPGYIGVDVLKHNGHIGKIFNSAHRLSAQKALIDAKVRKGCKIIKIDSEDYSIELLREKKNGSRNYQIEVVFDDDDLNCFVNIFEKLPKSIIGHYVFHFLGQKELDDLETLKDQSILLRYSFEEIIASRRIAQLFDTDMLSYQTIVKDAYHMYNHEHNNKLNYFIETKNKSEEMHTRIQDIWKFENFNLKSYQTSPGNKKDEFGLCISKTYNNAFVHDSNNLQKETIAFAKFASTDIEIQRIEDLELRDWITIVSEFETQVLTSDKDTYIKKILEPSKFFKYMVKEIINVNGEIQIRAGVIRTTHGELTEPAQFDFWITKAMIKNLKKSKKFHQDLMINKFKTDEKNSKEYCTIIFNDWERTTSTNSNRKEDGKSIEIGVINKETCDKFDIVFQQEQNQIVVRFTDIESESKIIAILENPSKLKIRMKPYEQGFFFYKNGMRNFDN